MAQVSPVEVTNLTSVNDLTRFLQPFISQVVSALNSGLTISDNFRAAIVGITFPASANTNIQVKHTLSSTPIGYLVIQSSVSGTVYNGNSPVLGSQFVNLKSSAASMFANVLFF